MVEGEIPRDREDPGATLAGFRGRRSRARDAQEHLLGEIAGRGLSDDPRRYRKMPSRCSAKIAAVSATRCTL
jgi:hypothetical protein